MDRVIGAIREVQCIESEDDHLQCDVFPDEGEEVEEVEVKEVRVAGNTESFVTSDSLVVGTREDMLGTVEGDVLHLENKEAVGRRFSDFKVYERDE